VRRRKVRPWRTFFFDVALFRPQNQLVISWRYSWGLSPDQVIIMTYQALTIVLALALLLSGIAQQADKDLNEALGIKNTPLLQLIVGIGTGLLILKSF